MQTDEQGDTGHDHGHGVAVGAYAISITATMSLIGAGVGALFGVTGISPPADDAARVLGGALVAGLAGRC